MRVCELDVERFLGFKSLKLEIDTAIQLVAGPNNAGKSSAIRLLEAFFADPTGESLRGLLPRNAYYRDLGARTLSSIQVWFTDLTEDERTAFAPILRRDNRFWIKVRCSRGGAVSYETSQRVTADDARRLYLEVLNRFHFVKIPSVRVAGDVDSNEPESLARLLDTLEAILIRTGSSRSTGLQQQFRDQMEPLETLVRETLDQSAAAIVADLPFQESEVRFKLPEPRAALRGMLESALIESGSDAPVAVSERGTGFQSALVLGILRYVASKEAQTGANLMFAIEEPEAFLHPQTQRAMAKIIGDIADDAQVLVTTHSSVLVDSFDISRIARLPLQSGGTTYERRKPVLDPTDAGRLSRYCSATNSELVFANAVVFVEGEGDYSVLERLLSRACAAPGGHYALGVTVIEAGGVGKIQYLVQLANVFGIRSYVIVDGDAVRTAGSGKREVLNILAARHPQPSKAERDSIMQQADQVSTTASQALANQKRLNQLLSPFDVFVLSSDLEGLFLDALGVAGVVDALGPGRDGSIDASFASTLSTAPDAYEQLASWMGSRGWNSNRKKSGKLEPHLAPYLLDDCLALGDPLPAALQPLVAWLEQIIASVRLAPV